MMAATTIAWLGRPLPGYVFTCRLGFHPTAGQSRSTEIGYAATTGRITPDRPQRWPMEDRTLQLSLDTMIQVFQGPTPRDLDHIYT